MQGGQGGVALAMRRPVRFLVRQRLAAAQLGRGLEAQERQRRPTGEWEENGAEFRVRFGLEELLEQTEHSPGHPAARSSGRGRRAVTKSVTGNGERNQEDAWTRLQKKVMFS